MTKYRIIKVKGYENSYKLQKRMLFIFWVDETLLNDLEFCEWKLNELIKRDKAKKANPKNIIVKEY